MNQAKLTQSIEIFKQYYVDRREYYDEDEREWKVWLSKRLQEVFAYDNVTGDSFYDSLTTLFEDSGVTGQRH
jgi:hypothetical protein